MSIFLIITKRALARQQKDTEPKSSQMLKLKFKHLFYVDAFLIIALTPFGDMIIPPTYPKGFVS